MTNLKVIFLDIDGTLTNNQGIISPNIKKIIRKLNAKKIMVVLASGRNFLYTTEISKQIGASKYIVASNGSVVGNYETKKIILQENIPIDILKKLLEFSKSHNLIIHARSINCNFDLLDINDITSDIVSVNIESTNYDRMLVIPKLFKDIFPELSITNSSKELYEEKRIKNKVYFHDIALKGTSKGNGILELLDYLNIDPKDTLTIGDSDNDISMALVSGYSVAMGNATKGLKIVSNKTINSNEEKGLEIFLNLLLTNKEI